MISYVNSFEEVKTSPVMFNDAANFFDNNQDRFYCKAVDSMGRASICTYEYHQIPNEKPLTSADFVPREQFDALSAKIDNLMSILTAQSANTPQQPDTPQLQTTHSKNSKEVK